MGKRIAARLPVADTISPPHPFSTVAHSAVGPSTYSLRPRMPNNNPKTRISTLINNSIFSNPFTLTVMVFSSSLAIASLLIPAQQLAPLDKVVALLQSIAMFYIAYPAAIATGKALLQTAPPTYEYGGAMNNLRRVLEEVSDACWGR